MKQRLHTLLRTGSTKQESFENRIVPLDASTKQKIDSIVKAINKEMEQSETSKEFCENSHLFHFIEYLLKINPAAFFDEADPNDPLLGSKTKETFQDATEEKTSSDSSMDSLNAQNKETAVLDMFKKRALALF